MQALIQNFLHQDVSSVEHKEFKLNIEVHKRKINHRQKWSDHGGFFS